MDEALLEQIVTAFTGEAAELLEKLSLELEPLAAARGPELIEHAREAMRLAHTLKGGGLSVGLDAFGQTAHALEDVLAPLARGEQADAGAAMPGLRELVAALHVELRRGLEARAQLRRAVRQTVESSDHDAPRDDQGSVRVDAARLDALMGFTGDLLLLERRFALDTRHLDGFHEELSALVAKLPEGHRKDLAALAGSLGAFLRRHRQETTSLTRLASGQMAAVRGLRLLPLQSAAPAWRRAALEAAHALGRPVEVRVELGDIAVDKRVLDMVREPVVHLVRNAVGHGIEPAEVRAARGKPAAGRVLVTAEMDGGQVRLEVSDDGAGFDLPRLGEAAVAAGKLDAAQLARLEPADVIALAFEPGLSTTRTADAVSGRGMGLDVVKRALTELGGSVEPLAPGPLGGASFRLRLPLDVLATRLLLVRLSGVVCGLPAVHVERAARARADSVRLVDGVPTVQLGDGEPVRLVWPERERTTDATWLPLVVVRQGRARVGLVVTEVLAEDELVVRPLPWNLQRVRGVAGAASLPDGSVAVVLDVATVLAGGAPRAQAVSGGRRRAGKTRLLVVDDSVTHRTLEQNILMAAGYEVDVAPDGLAGWRALEHGEFDLLVSDVEMPGLDGIELTRRVRAHPRLGELPVVLVTGLDKRADVERGLEAGANEYVVKGQLEPERLLQAVARCV